MAIERSDVDLQDPQEGLKDQATAANGVLPNKELNVRVQLQPYPWPCCDGLAATIKTQPDKRLMPKADSCCCYKGHTQQ